MDESGKRLRSGASALLTDLYELTMACGYWKAGLAATEAAFHVSFREAPFRSGFTVAAGLGDAIDYLRRLRFSDDDLAYLATLRGNDGGPLLDAGFLEHLRAFAFACDVDAVPEGTVVFPHEPLLRVTGPILQAQLVETALLNLLNFQTLVATKAARVCLAAQGDPVIEFGLRRAQGVDGALAASRASYLGGCAGTSNVLAGRLFGIPVKGTHAHSWVMAFGDEEAAFRAYAGAMPNNCVFLVDTYDTLAGVRRAVAIGRELRAGGHELAGIRLDSGDLAFLSIEARRLLDEGGFPKAQILASNDLDEHVITSLKQQGATIAVWGVGTRLVTAYDHPALGGVYKLTAVRAPGAPWSNRIKLSEQVVKTSIPGLLDIRRFAAGGLFVGDMLFDENAPPAPDAPATIVDPADPLRRKTMPAGAVSHDLLVPVFRAGRLVYDEPPLEAAREHAQAQLRGFHASIKRLLNPHEYPVGLEAGLHEERTRLIHEARALRRKAPGPSPSPG